MTNDLKLALYGVATAQLGGLSGCDLSLLGV